MSLWNRIFRPKVKQNPVVPVILSSLYGPVVWTPQNYANLSKAAYENCMVAFSCINLIAKTAAGLEFQLEDARGKEIEESTSGNGQLLSLLNYPSKYESKRTFITKIVSHLTLTGNAYVLRVVVAGSVRFLYSLRPDRMTVIKGSGFDMVGGYRYTVNGRHTDFDRDQVCHLKFFSPTDDFYGYGPIAAASRGIDIANLADEWNAKLLTNDMKPPGMFSTEGSLNQQQIDSLNQQIKEEYSGSENAGKPLLGQGGLKFTPFSFNQKEMDWLTGDKMNAGKICSVFGVAPELIGASTEKKYSNYGEARKSLHTDVVLPMMAFITDEFERWLVPMYPGVRHIKIDTEQIEALQEDRGAKFTYLQQCDWLTINEKRLATGYGEMGTEADVILVPLGKIPLARQVEEPEPVPAALQPKPDDAIEGEAVDDEDDDKARRLKSENKGSFWTVPERKEQLWRSFEVRVKTREKSFEQIAQAYLLAQAKDIKRKVAVAGSLEALTAGDILDVNVEAKRYVNTFYAWYVDHFRRAGEAGVQATKGNLFFDSETKESWLFDMSPEMEKELRRMVFESGTQVNKTAVEKIYQLLTEAQKANMTVAEFATKIFDNVEELSRWRSELWARTESARVDNYGQVEGYRQTEFVKLKGWMCSFVPDSRDDHMIADGQEVGLNDNFNIGGESIPHPGAGSPGNACNCLCSTYPVVPDL